jgi:hypothetical protein
MPKALLKIVKSTVDVAGLSDSDLYVHYPFIRRSLMETHRFFLLNAAAVVAAPV